MTFAPSGKTGASASNRTTSSVKNTSHHSTSHHSTHTRRGGAMWSASMTDVANQLHSVSKNRNLTSCMKVSTLEDSIRSCEQKKALLMEVKGVQYSMQNLLKPSPYTRKKLSKGVSLRNIPFPRWPSNRKPGDEEKASNELAPPVAQKQKNTVKFETLHFREYKVIAGTNPGVSKGGPALELAWEYDDYEHVNVDDFESAREPRKKLKEIKLSREERERRLRESGVTEREIRDSIKKVNLARGKRKKTLEMIDSGGQKNEEMKERIKYNFRKIMRLEKSESKKEDELWDNANKGSFAIN